MAIGTCCAPSYANLYLGEWERLLMADEQLTMYTDHIIMWLRYIDDVFITWDGPVDLLFALLARLNRNQFNLTFTMSYHPREVIFLDVMVLCVEDCAIKTHLY